MDVKVSIVALLCLFIQANGQTETTCSPQSRATDLNTCLASIRTRVMDKDLFWYGNQFLIDCPLGPASGINCLNTNIDSLGSRLFPNGIDLNAIDRYVMVDYTSAAGTYTGCGKEYTEAAFNFEVVPTSNAIESPWHLRDMPTISYDTQPEDLYTFVFIDTGNNILHMVVVNIPGNAIAQGEIIRQYNGPKVSSTQHNVYAYLILKQPARLTISDEWRNKITSREMGQFVLEDFIAAYTLTGPVGINWVVATGDAFSAQFMRDQQVLNTCPVIVGKELDKQSRPFLPSNSELTVGVDVHMTMYPISFSVCCQTYDFALQDFTLNALQNTLYNTAEVRSDNDLSITFSKVGLWFQKDTFTDADMYTLITVDPDVPSRPTVATEERPLLHMLVANIQGGDFNTGEVVQAYGGPTPPNDSPHYYYFLVYKQMAAINAADMPSYAGDNCNPGLTGRCLYDINRAVAEQNLTLVGASWMRAVKDDYVIFRQLDQTDESAVRATCSGRKGFDIPCPTDGADRINSVYVTVFIIAIFGCLFSRFTL